MISEAGITIGRRDFLRSIGAGAVTVTTGLFASSGVAADRILEIPDAAAAAGF